MIFVKRNGSVFRESYARENNESDEHSMTCKKQHSKKRMMLVLQLFDVNDLFFRNIVMFWKGNHLWLS